MKRLSLIEVFAWVLILAVIGAVGVPLYAGLRAFAPARKHRAELRALSQRMQPPRETYWIGNRTDLAEAEPPGMREAHVALPREARK